MPYYNRFDIVDAYYWFFADYHEGQWSEKYARLCKISTYFTPSRLANGPSSENAQEIYNQLVEKENL